MRTFMVPQEFSLHEALVLARPGDTILVAPGEYLGPLILATPDVRIISVEGHATFWLKAYLGSVIEIAADRVQLQRVSVIGGELGISIKANDVFVKSCVVAGARLAGIYIENSSGTRLKRNILAQNKIGLMLKGSRSMVARHNLIELNEIGALLENADENILEENELVCNQGRSWYLDREGSGLILCGSSRNEIVRNVLAGNQVCGIRMEGRSRANFIKRNSIVGNGLCSIFNLGDYTIDASENWFGSDEEKVALLGNVLVTPWLTKPTEPNGKTTRVPEDYVTIQGAIECAQPGDTIMVDARGGPYREALSIDLPQLSLRGVNGTPVIEGPAEAPAIEILRDRIELFNFTIQGGKGILLNCASRCVLRDCTITGVKDYGIMLRTASHNVLENLNIYGCQGDGIVLEASALNHLRGNTLKHNKGNGLVLSGTVASWAGRIHVPELEPPGGLRSCSCDNHVETNNISDNHGDGLLLSHACDNLIENNVITRNRRIGISLYFYSQNNKIKANSVMGNGQEGIRLETNCRQTTLARNVVQDNGATGIHIKDSHTCLLISNRCSHNRGAGIALEESSDNCILRGNLVEQNESFGICLLESKFPKGRHNIIIKNKEALDPQQGWPKGFLKKEGHE